MEAMKISKSIKDEIKNELKTIFSNEKIVDLDYWDCMGDVMVSCITIHNHVAKKYTYSYTIDCKYLQKIGETRYL